MAGTSHRPRRPRPCPPSPDATSAAWCPAARQFAETGEIDLRALLDARVAAPISTLKEEVGATRSDVQAGHPDNQRSACDRLIDAHAPETSKRDVPDGFYAAPDASPHVARLMH